MKKTVLGKIRTTWALLLALVMLVGCLPAGSLAESFTPTLTVFIDDWVYGQYSKAVNGPSVQYTDDNEVTYTYYIYGGEGLVKTTPENSGAETIGGLPKNVGMSYFVEATEIATGATGNASFHINPADPEADLFVVSGNPDLVYSGQAKSSITVAPKDTVVGIGEYGIDRYEDISRDPINLEDIIQVGSYYVVVAVRGTGNYATRDALRVPFEIQKKTVTVTASDQEVKVGENIATGVGQATLSGAVQGHTLSEVTLTSSGTDTATTSGTITASGAKIQDAKGNDVTANYDITYAGGTLKVAQGQATISGLTVLNKAYDGTTTADFTKTTAVLVGVSDADKDDVTLVVDQAKAEFADKNIGQNKAVTFSGFKLEGAKKDNYALVQPTGLTGTITPCEVVVGGITARDKTYDGTTAVELDFSGATFTGLVKGETLSVTATGAFVDAAAGDNKTVTISNLALDGEDKGNYKLAAIDQQASATAKISRKAVTVTAADQEVNVGDSIDTGVGQATLSGALAGHTLSAVTLTPSGTDKATTSGTITPDSAVIRDASGNEVTANYAITYTDGKLTVVKKDQNAPGAPEKADASADQITLKEIANGEYSMNGTDWQTSPVFSGLKTNTEYTFYQRYGETDESNPSPASAATTISTMNHTHEWSYTAKGAVITATCADSDGGHGTSKTATLTINAPPLTKARGTESAEATITGSIGGVSNPQIVYSSGATVLNAAPVNAGSYTASITLGGATASVSYTIEEADAPVAPTAASVGTTSVTLVEVSGCEYSVDNATWQASPVFTGLKNNTEYAFYQRYKASGDLEASPASSAKISTMAHIHEWSYTADGATITVVCANTDGGHEGDTTATVTIVKPARTKTTESESAEATISGAIDGVENPKITYAQGETILDAAPATAGTFTASITLGGATASVTYTIRESSMLTITGLTVADKTYDGTTAATFTGTPALVGVSEGDDVSLTGTGVAAFMTANAGREKTVEFSGFKLAGNDVDKYTLAQPTAKASITPKEVTVSGITAENKAYDGEKTATLDCSKAVFTGLVQGDTLTVTAKGAFEFPNPDEDIKVLLSDLTLGGASSGNYQLSAQGQQATAVADITPKAVTISGLVVTDKIYDGTTAATLTGTAKLEGIIGAEDVYLSGETKAAFEDASAGTEKKVVITGFELEGRDEYNYVLTALEMTMTGNITKREATVEAKAQEVALGGAITPGVEMATLTGALEGHTLTNVILTASDTAAATTAGTITPSGAVITDAAGNNVTANYQIAYATGTLTVNKADQAAPAAPEMAEAKAAVITLKEAEGCEYSIDQTAWQDSPVFAGLIGSTEYTFWQRKKGNENYNPSPASESATFKTLEPEKEYTVSFDPNEGSGTMDSVKMLEGSEGKLPKNAFTRDEYNFAGWNTGKDGSGKAYADEGTIILSGDTTLYAQWKLSHYAVTFVPQNGQDAFTVQVAADQPVTRPVDPTLENFSFRGWFVLEGGTAKAYDFSAPVTRALTLYGGWGGKVDKEIAAGKSLTLQAPVDRVSFSSATPEIATVSEDGTVSALKQGEAVIEGRLDGRTVAAYTWAFKVTGPTVKLSESAVTIKGINGSYSVKAEEYSAKGDKIVSVESSNPEIATAEYKTDTVKIASKGFGDAEITVTTKKGATAVLKVNVETVSITLSVSTTEKSRLEFTGSTTVNVESYSLEGDYIERVELDSDHIATATFEGDTITINAIKGGKAAITVTTHAGASATIHVKAKEVTVKFSPKSLKFTGFGTKTVSVSETIESAVSMNEGVATVEFEDKTLTVTAHRIGKSTIVVTTANGGSGEIKVTVNKASIGSFSPKDVTINGIGSQTVVMNKGKNVDEDTVESVIFDKKGYAKANFEENRITITSKKVINTLKANVFTNGGAQKVLKVTINPAHLTLSGGNVRQRTKSKQIYYELIITGGASQTVQVNSDIKGDKIKSIEVSDKRILTAEVNDNEITIHPKCVGSKVEIHIATEKGGLALLTVTIKASKTKSIKMEGKKKLSGAGSTAVFTVTNIAKDDSIEKVYSSNEDIATVAFEGNEVTVTAKSLGNKTIKTDKKVYISIITQKGLMACQSVTIKNAGSFTLSTSTLTIKDGRKQTVTVSSWAFADDYIESVESNDKDVAKAKFEGGTITITPKQVGKAEILVTTHFGKKALIKVDVKSSRLSYEGSKKVRVSETGTLTITKYPVGDNKIVSVKSSNKSIATASFDGDTITIKGKKTGKVEIYVNLKKTSVTIAITVK